MVKSICIGVACHIAKSALQFIYIGFRAETSIELKALIWFYKLATVAKRDVT
jgi:hypothetical protein